MSIYVPSGKLVLLHNIDIDSSYNHEYYFANVTAQYNFFYGKKFKEYNDGTYQRKNLNSIRINASADEIRECKYIMWQNPTFSTKWYYAFVLGIDYENPKTSIIRYQLDVYQTYLFEMNWKQSFIERQHCDRWRTVGGVTYPNINTEVEDLEIGSEYQTVSRTKFEQIPDVAWMILGVTKFTSSLIPVSVADIPTGVYYIFVPFNVSQKRSCIFYAGSTEDHPFISPALLLREYATNTSLVNSLVSCTITPFIPFDFTYTIDSSGQYPKYHMTAVSPIDYVSVTGSNVVYRLTGMYSRNFDALTKHEFTDSENIYANFPSYSESKMLMYPFSFMELTNERGSVLPLKMEYINGGIGNVTIGVFGTLNFKNKALYVIKNYLSNDINYIKEYGLSDESNNEVPIINDYTASFMQSNSNALAVAESNAKINLLTSYENAQRTYSTGMSNRNIQALSGVATGLTQAFAGTQHAGTPYGEWNSMVGGFSSAIQTGINTLSDFMTSGNNIETTQANARNSALSDYMTSIESTLAKKRDAKQVPPTASSLGGDFLFNIINDCNAIYLIRKTIFPEYADKIQDFFKQFGYKYNKLEVPQFHTRASWNYIKMAQPNVSGNIPMDDLLAIKGIFQKGITLWHGDYVGNYSRNNDEI